MNIDYQTFSKTYFCGGPICGMWRNEIFLKTFLKKKTAKSIIWHVVNYFLNAREYPKE